MKYLRIMFYLYIGMGVLINYGAFIWGDVYTGSIKWETNVRLLTFVIQSTAVERALEVWRNKKWRMNSYTNKVIKLIFEKILNALISWNTQCVKSPESLLNVNIFHNLF